MLRKHVNLHLLLLRKYKLTAVHTRCECLRFCFLEFHEKTLLKFAMQSSSGVPFSGNYFAKFHFDSNKSRGHKTLHSKRY